MKGLISLPGCYCRFPAEVACEEFIYKRAAVTEELFQLFSHHLKTEELAACGGQIMDSTIILVPKQRNWREENKAIKQGELPERWEDNPNQLGQKD